MRRVRVASVYDVGYWRGAAVEHGQQQRGVVVLAPSGAQQGGQIVISLLNVLYAVVIVFVLDQY